MKLSIILPVGLMLFSFFFGAGNLIFPPTLGQQAGSNLIAATLGFCLTGVGMPLLGILAIAMTNATSPDHAAMPVGSLFARIITVLCALTIGPFFAIPRTAATSFDMGILPLLPEGYSTIGLAIYSAFFFILTWILATNQSKLIDNVGKIITPLLLATIAVLLCMVIFQPMGNPQAPPVPYKHVGFFYGFQEGYQTMDLLCSLLFGTAAVLSIKGAGIQKQQELNKVCICSGLIAGFFLAVIYAGLTYAGATSINVFGFEANGGLLMNKIATYYLGFPGKLLLAAIIFFACITTSIGLHAAIGEYFSGIWAPTLTYKRAVTGICIFSFCVANVGLQKIIALSIPVIFFLYPVIIAVVLLNIATPILHRDETIFQWCVGATTIFALLDGIKAAGINLGILEHYLSNYLPFYNIGFGWLSPCLVGLIIGYVLKKK